MGYMWGDLRCWEWFLRQFFAIRETIFYNKELQRMQQELHRKNEALSNANRQLEAQVSRLRPLMNNNFA